MSQKNHYVPQFYLKNFAIDEERKRISTVSKNGDYAVWSERSIEGLGYERDLYLHNAGGIPVCVESVINERIETPISRSDTWAKISSGQADALDRSDKPILYALIRHFEVRTPHYLDTTKRMIEIAASNSSEIDFTVEEREAYKSLKENPQMVLSRFNQMASSLAWTKLNFERAFISVLRSPVPLRSLSTPVMAISVPTHEKLHLPLPGMLPYQLVLALNKTTLLTLVLADFDDAFLNTEIDTDVAHGFNRQFLAQFAYFSATRHLITGRDGLVTDMTWAPYDFVQETKRRMTFKRRSKI